MQMSTLLAAEPEANFAHCSRAFSLQANKGQDGHVHQVMLSENDMMSEEFSSFQIRNFVSTVRHSDFSKCWPFRHKILEKCLSAGLKPFLPPFEPPLRGCDNREADHDVSYATLQQKLSRDVSDEPFEESKQQDCEKSDRSDSAVFNEKSQEGDKDAKDAVGVDFSDKESIERNPSQGTPVLAKASTVERRLSQAAETPVLESSQAGSASDLKTDPNVEHSCVIPPESVARTVDDKKVQEGMSSHAEMVTNAEKDFSILRSTSDEAEAGLVLKVTGPYFSDTNGSSPRKAQQHHKGKHKSLSSDCTVGEEQASFHKSKSSKAGLIGKAQQEESQIPSEQLGNSVQATALNIEHDIVETPTKSCRNVEDYTFTGLNLDILVPQVCPVCLNFTSTSNTALNAHIDHCLESVLPGEKGESRVGRTRIKPRKMRSMADICATAPSRTLEDLERSSKLWALNNEASKEEDSCTPSWKSGLVRRQPRTSLHRGPAWKARNISDTEDVPQVSELELQPQLEKSQRRNLGTEEHTLWTASRTPMGATEVELEQSCKGQQPVFEEQSGPSRVSSSIKLNLVGKKKKGQLTGISSSKDVLTSGGHCLSDEDQDDHMWSIPANLLGFTPVDTSAEEEKRLMQQIRRAKEGGFEAKTLEHQGSVNDFASRLGKSITKHCSGGSQSVDFTDSRSPNEILKKRKRTQVDDDVIAEEICLMVHSERPAKNRRAAPKIKSLLTVVANSRKDMGRDGFEGPSSQKKLCPSQWQEKTNDKGAFSVPSGLPNEHPEINPKRKSAGVAGEGCCEADKYVHPCPSELPSTLENVHSNNLSEHVKSRKGGSVLSGRALTEHEMIHGCSPPNCAEEEMPLSISAEDFGIRSVQGEEKGSLMSSLSKCQARMKDSSWALGKRKITSAKAVTEEVASKAPFFTSKLAGLTENGSSHCRSRFEYLRRAFLNVSSRKTSSVNREEVSRTTSHPVSFPEQAGKSHLPSRALPACNPTASVSPFNNMILRENSGGCVPERLAESRKSFFPVDAANVRSVDNIRTNQLTFDSIAASNCPNSLTTNNQASLANLSPMWSENSQLSTPTRGAKFVRNIGQSLTATESVKNLGNCKLHSSVKHGVQQACFLAKDPCEHLGSHGNESSVSRKEVRISENGSLLVTNRMDKCQGQSNSTEDLQRTVRAMGMESSHQSQQGYLGSRFSTSELGSVRSSCLHESGQNFSCESNGHDCAPLPERSTERMTLSSSLLADLARTMAGSSMNSQDPLPPNNFCIGEHSRTSNSCFQCTPKNLNRAREYLNLMPLQGVANACHPSASNGTMQPQLLHTALQTMKGHMSTMNSECSHRIGSNMDVSMKLCNTLSTISPYRVDSLNARESLLGGELSSNLNNYGTVEYSGDQGVVHIFGSPVFKLMGQNVIVTNSSIKTLGMEGSCNPNGAQSFHPPSLITHLGVLPETQNHYSHKMSQELYASSRLAACHGDACMQRNHSFQIDSLEISPHSLQNPGPANSVHSKMLAYKEQAVSKPQIPQRILGERSTVLSTASEMIAKKPMVAHAVNKVPAEVFVDVPSQGGNSLSAAPSRGCGLITKQSDRYFPADSCLLAPNEPLQGQLQTLQSTSPLYLGDTHKLSVAGNTHYRSGTLADIVQSSERSTH